MINKSSYCVCYYDESYIPTKRNNSGTKLAYDYAIRKGAHIMNVHI